MEKWEEVLDREIDQCFEALFQAGAMTEDELEYLQQTQNKSCSDYQLCFELIVDRIFNCIKEGKLERWDFDLWDKRWKNRSGSPAGAEISLPIFSKKLAVKRGILTKIVRIFRQRCLKDVDELMAELDRAEDIRAVRRVKDQAISKGIFIDNGRLSHNHSWLNSKRLFAQYHQKIRRFVYR